MRPIQKKNMLWRKAGVEKKEGSGGRVANFVVAVAYNKGVICCEQYLGNMNGQLFANFLRENVPQMFEHSANPKGKLFLQDGDPSQNSKEAHIAVGQVGCKLFSIPPWSPDINPIENVFHFLRKKLGEDALAKEITLKLFQKG